MELNNSDLYRISIALLKQLYKEGMLTEQEFIDTDEELKNIYNIEKLTGILEHRTIKA